MARFGPFAYERYADRIDLILEALIETGTALEVNTGGLWNGPGETYPGLEVVARYRELGGERLSVGSDAHRAADVGQGMAETVAALGGVIPRPRGVLVSESSQ